MGVNNSNNDETDFAISFSVEVKFITTNEFIFEIYGDAGKNLLNDNAIDVVPKFGLTLGKRILKNTA